MPNRSTIPDPLTPPQRLAQIAAILARGVARFRQRPDQPSFANLDDSRQPGLEVVSKPRLCVSHRPADNVGG
jgi:hypothetical protein